MTAPSNADYGAELRRSHRSAQERQMTASDEETKAYWTGMAHAYDHAVALLDASPNDGSAAP